MRLRVIYLIGGLGGYKTQIIIDPKRGTGNRERGTEGLGRDPFSVLISHKERVQVPCFKADGLGGGLNPPPRPTPLPIAHSLFPVKICCGIHGQPKLIVGDSISLNLTKNSYPTRAAIALIADFSTHSTYYSNPN